MNQPTLAETVVAAAATKNAKQIRECGKQLLARNRAYVVRYRITGSVVGQPEKVNLRGQGTVCREKDEPGEKPPSGRQILQALRLVCSSRRWRGIAESVRRGVFALKDAEQDPSQIEEVNGLLSAISAESTRAGAIKFRPSPAAGKRGVLPGGRAKAPAG